MNRFYVLFVVVCFFTSCNKYLKATYYPSSKCFSYKKERGIIKGLWVTERESDEILFEIMDVNDSMFVNGKYSICIDKIIDEYGEKVDVYITVYDGFKIFYKIKLSKVDSTQDKIKISPFLMNKQ
jgi:hypothetical protein